MGSLALSRVEDRPAPSIADEVGAIARKELAPLAAAIDGGACYPEELLRRFGEVGAWSSHLPGDGPADLRCAIQAMAAIGEVCGATAFMAWCQNTLVWYAGNSTNLKLAAKFGDGFASGRILGGTGLRICPMLPSAQPYLPGCATNCHHRDTESIRRARSGRPRWRRRSMP